MVSEAQASEEEAEFRGGIVTRIYRGKAGHIVMTVHTNEAHAAGLLRRICGAAIEAAVFRAFRDRLQQD